MTKEKFPQRLIGSPRWWRGAEVTFRGRKSLRAKKVADALRREETLLTKPETLISAGKEQVKGTRVSFGLLRDCWAACGDQGWREVAHLCALPTSHQPDATYDQAETPQSSSKRTANEDSESTVPLFSNQPQD